MNGNKKKLHTRLQLLLTLPHFFSVHGEQGKKFEISLHDATKDAIQEWLNMNKNGGKFPCNYKSRPVYKNTFLRDMKAPEIKSFPCREGSEQQHFTFTGGFISDGYLNKKGKLSFFTDKEWLKLPYEKRVGNEKGNICFLKGNLRSKEMKEIIGSFKNGSLHGNAHIKYRDKSYSIGRFRNGKTHGIHKYFNPNGKLVESGPYENGWPKGYHWQVEHGHLMYRDRTIVQEDVMPSLVFPIQDDGTLKDPMAGDYLPYSGALENIHEVALKGIISNISECYLQLEYELKSKNNFSYSIQSKTKFPLFGFNHSLLCDIIPRHKIPQPRFQLQRWFEAIDRTLLPQKADIAPLSNVIKAHEILWKLRPIEEKPKHEYSAQLISHWIWPIKL